jgi:hypothetical protein
LKSEGRGAQSEKLGAKSPRIELPDINAHRKFPVEEIKSPLMYEKGEKKADLNSIPGEESLPTGRGDSQTFRLMSEGSTLANLPLSGQKGPIASLKSAAGKIAQKGKKTKKSAKIEPVETEENLVNETENNENLMTERDLWKPAFAQDLEKGPNENGEV